MILIAKTIYGLEELLAHEIKELGGTEIEIGNRAVTFEGDLETMYKINLWSRTALRVIKPFLSFTAHNETVYYKRLRRYDWTKLFRLDQTFMVTSVVNSEYFNHSKYLSQKTKDAIVDLFRMHYDQQRPSIDLKNPDFVIDVHCRGTEFSISLDSSGRSLHRRGYRQSQRQAPLNEALAAGMIMHSGWDISIPLLDPMCGSGTLLTEAYTIAKNIPPRKSWDHFAFMNWSDFDQALWNKVVNDAKAAENDKTPTLLGFDIDKKQVWETQELLHDLGYSDIKIKLTDFTSEEKPFENGMIITNPPYGLRLGEEEEMADFYKSIGDTLKQSYSGWSAWIISGNKNAIKRVGLKTSKRLTLFNGAIECKYHRYDLYDGSKKKNKKETT